MTPLKKAGGHPIKIDVADPESIETGVATVIAESGRVDIPVNVAGTALHGSVEDPPSSRPEGYSRSTCSAGQP
jgi:NAD(P)-dependent dehydrogenase (short-subunit alcohol dehydrogenase family)